MVRFTCILERVNKQLLLRKTFVDRARIFVKAGNGGQGMPKYGGLGGDGGDVIAVATTKKSLIHLIQRDEDGKVKTRFIAKAGNNSHRRCLVGNKGEDIQVPVPIGITVSTTDGGVIGELNEEGDELIVAKGGAGGGPQCAYQATPGEKRSIILDLKLLADIGLVGFPNAGKSTLLQAVSRAKPKIANYPFTTIQPQLGALMYEDGRRITMADLPGLVEGAYLNIGMGHSFLKHIERTKVLCFVVDIHGFQLNPDQPHRNALDTILLLNKELELYNKDIMKKPAVLLLNKTDDLDQSSQPDEVCQFVKQCMKNKTEIEQSNLPQELIPNQLVAFENIFEISAKHQVNTEELKVTVREMLDKIHEEELAIDLDRELAALGEKNRAYFPPQLT